jgi:hypothetical protein
MIAKEFWGCFTDSGVPYRFLPSVAEGQTARHNTTDLQNMQLFGTRTNAFAAIFEARLGNLVNQAIFVRKVTIVVSGDFEKP